MLADGGTAHVRPIVEADAQRWSSFISRLSPQTIYFRFFSEHPRIGPAELEHFTRVDYVGRVAFVALLGDDIVGVGRYDRIEDTNVAEVAFVIEDRHQGRGLGSILLEHLAAAARERGLLRFEAEVLMENVKMLSVFQDAGYRVESEIEGGSARLAFAIEPTEQSLEVMRAREHRAEAHSIARLLSPRTVALVGASRTPGSVGNTVLHHILSGRFAGPVYPVNPAAPAVASVRTYPSVRDIPDKVDLGVVIAPVPALEEVVAELGAKQACGLIVLTETRDARLDHELASQARSFGMRMVGPTSLGLICSALGLNASVSPILPPAGPVGVFSQSGPLGATLLEQAVRRGLGISTFVSAGNQADVSCNALLQHWEEDTSTDVVALYLEMVGNPRKFARLARRVSRRKPIVALTTAPTQVEATLLRQAGVIRVDTVTQLFDVALLLSRQPLPAGRRLAVLGNSVALGRLTLSAAESLGLACTGAHLVAHDAPAAEWGQAVEQAARQADTVLAIFVPPVDPNRGETAAVVARAAAGTGKPVLSIVLSFDGASPELGSVPCYQSPDSAVGAVARAVEYAEFRSRPTGLFPMPPPVDAAAARTAVADGRVSDLLGVYGIEVDEAVGVRSADEAVAAASALGWPVTLKATAPRYRHRPELRAVRLDLADEAQLRTAYGALTRLDGPALVVQRMAPPGVTVTVGAVEDPVFGPLVSFGVAGVATDLLGDRAYRILPLSDTDAAELVRSVRAAPLLFGYRGRPAVDVAALEVLLIRVARLADELPTVTSSPARPGGIQLESLELNPVVVSRTGLRVLSARARLGPAVMRGDVGPRRIR